MVLRQSLDLNPAVLNLEIARETYRLIVFSGFILVSMSCLGPSWLSGLIFLDCRSSNRDDLEKYCAIFTRCDEWHNTPCDHFAGPGGACDLTALQTAWKIAHKWMKQTDMAHW